MKQLPNVLSSSMVSLRLVLIIANHSFLRVALLVQNQAVRISTRTTRCDHITEVLADLHWLRVEQRIICKILILTKSFVDLSALLYLRELAGDYFLLVASPICNSSSKPLTHYFKRSFIYAAPTEWNIIGWSY